MDGDHGSDLFPVMSQPGLKPVLEPGLEDLEQDVVFIHLEEIDDADVILVG